MVSVVMYLTGLCKRPQMAFTFSWLFLVGGHDLGSETLDFSCILMTLATHPTNCCVSPECRSLWMDQSLTTSCPSDCEQLDACGTERPCFMQDNDKSDVNWLVLRNPWWTWFDTRCLVTRCEPNSIFGPSGLDENRIWFSLLRDPPWIWFDPRCSMLGSMIWTWFGARCFETRCEHWIDVACLLVQSSNIPHG